MARSWTEFLGDAEGPYETVEAQRGFVGRLRESLSKSRRALTEYSKDGGVRLDRAHAQGSTSNT